MIYSIQKSYWGLFVLAVMGWWFVISQTQKNLVEEVEININTQLGNWFKDELFRDKDQRITDTKAIITLAKKMNKDWEELPVKTALWHVVNHLRVQIVAVDNLLVLPRLAVHAERPPLTMKKNGHEIAVYLVFTTEWNGLMLAFSLMMLLVVFVVTGKLPRNLFYNDYDAAEEVRALIKRGEGQSIEFKETFGYAEMNPPADVNIACQMGLFKVMNAFFNTNRGVILVGVTDNGEISGVNEEAELRGGQDAFQLYFNNRFIAVFLPECVGHFRGEMIYFNDHQKYVFKITCYRRIVSSGIMIGGQKKFHLKVLAASHAFNEQEFHAVYSPSQRLSRRIAWLLSFIVRDHV